MSFWKPSTKVYRFSSVRDAAETAREREENAFLERFDFGDATQVATLYAGSGLSPDQKKQRWLAENAASFRAGRFFLLNDPQLRGSIVTAIAAKGAGASAQLGINPFGFVGLNTEVTVSQTIKGAKQRAVVVHGGPSSVVIDGEARSVPRPILLNSFIGAYFESTSQVGLEVSVGFSAKAVAGAKRTKDGESAGYTERKAESKGGSVEAEEKDANEPSVACELAVASFEAKAGASIEGSYTYDKFISADPSPLAFAHGATAALDADVGAVLQDGSVKTLQKRRACDHVNAHSAAYRGKTLNVHREAVFGAITNTIGGADVLKVLREVRTTDRAILAENKEHIDALTAFESSAHPGKHLLILSSHKADGKAGVFASAEAQARAGGLGAGAEAKVWAGLGGARKRSYARYQSAVTTEAYARPGLRAGEVEPAEVMTTYDTAIDYSSFKLGVELTLEADAFGFGLVPEGVTGALDTANEAMAWKPNCLNRMRYRTAIACWVRPKPGIAPLRDPSAVPKYSRYKDFLKEGAEVKVDALVGTGVAFGESFVVGNLRKLYARILEASASSTATSPAERLEELALSGTLKADAVDDAQLGAIAEQLRVTPAKLLAFLDDMQVRLGVLASRFEPSGSVLLEATFRTTASQLSLRCYTDADDVFQASLDAGTSDTLFGAVGSEPESMRLRYRRRDVVNNDSTLFKLGFDKIQGNSLKITLERVDRAGHDGVIDLATVFFDQGLAALQASDPAAAYAGAVPPAALFTQ
jgi:hypothetical protein